MTALVQDTALVERLIAERKATGADRFDEVWEGVYVMSPMPNPQHQHIALGVAHVLYGLFDEEETGQTFPGVNVSDRRDEWTKNYRCPDVALYLNSNPAELCGAFWYGGPDFAVEIISPDDRTREKFDFYAQVNTRELLIVDRDPWALELYRLTEGELKLVGKSTLEAPDTLHSEVVPLTIKLVAGKSRPQIEVLHDDGKQQWVV